MVAKGRFVDRPPLPQVGNDADQLIEIIPDEKLRPPTQLPTLKSEPLPVIIKPAQVVAPDTLFSPLPLVKRTIFCLRAGTPGDDGLSRLFHAAMEYRNAGDLYIRSGDRQHGKDCLQRGSSLAKSIGNDELSATTIGKLLEAQADN
jgi:hypothetical protein